MSLRVHEQVLDEAACTAACAANEQCLAVTHKAATGKCEEFTKCELMRPTSGVTALFKPGLEWPTSKAEVVWRAPAVLVIASYDRDLSFLGDVRADRADVVVYQKKGQPPTFAAQHTTALRYFAHMPNFGEKGGSRETAVYFQFLLDFYHNLPKMIIFSQDEASYLSHWKPFLSGQSVNVPLGRSFWSGGVTKDNCMCSWTVEDFYGPEKYGWFNELNWYDSHVLGNDWYALPESQEKRVITWPQAAFFAIGRKQAHSRSRDLYAVSRSLVRVEHKHHTYSTLEWANVFERAWFRIFFASQFEPNGNENASTISNLLRASGSEAISLWESQAGRVALSASQQEHRVRTCRV